MARPPRQHLSGAFYHVTHRGNHREPLFFWPDERGALCALVAEASVRHGARVHGYCWMPNHIHLVIQVGDVPLGKIMHAIAGRHARAVQWRLRRTGHLFEGRYFAQHIDCDEYLKKVLRYIDLNPVEAGLVGCPGDYRWSSCAAYLGLREELWVTTEFGLRLFGATVERARVAYGEFLGVRTSVAAERVGLIPVVHSPQPPDGAWPSWRTRQAGGRA